MASDLAAAVDCWRFRARRLNIGAYQRVGELPGTARSAVAGSEL